MVFIKKVNNSDPGTADLTGGNDWDKLDDYHDDVDITPAVAKVNTNTQFRSGKFKLRDSDNTHNYIFNTSNLSADSTVTYPALGTSDEPLFKTFAATVTGKTFDILNNTFAGRSWTVLMTKSGSTYYAIKYDGTVISSSTTAETVISAAIAVGGILYFAHTQTDNGNYTYWDLSGAFTGFTINSTHCYFVAEGQGDRVHIGVPNGFTGTLFKFDGVGVAGITGLGMYEQGSPARDWTAIKFEHASAESIVFQNFKDMQIYDPSVGIEIETSHSSAYFNSNSFQNIRIWSPDVAGVLFDQTAGDIDENIFIDVTIQCRAGSSGQGFKDINGTNNMFIGCKVWDPDNTVIETNIKSTADGTTIIGGRMAGSKGHFINEGTKTLTIDSGNTITTNVQLTPDLVKMGEWHAGTATAGSGILNGRISAITVGTGANSGTTDSTGRYQTFDTGATINSLSGIQTSAQLTRRILNPYFKTAIYLNSVSNVRVYAGFINTSSAPTSSSDALNVLAGVALWLDTDVSANWKRGHNDGSGIGVYDDTSVAAATSTLYPIEIYAVADDRFRFVFNGTSTDISSEIPSSTSNLGFWIYMENTTGASRTMRGYYAELRTDK